MPTSLLRGSLDWSVPADMQMASAFPTAIEALSKIYLQHRVYRKYLQIITYYLKISLTQKCVFLLFMSHKSLTLTILTCICARFVFTFLY